MLKFALVFIFVISSFSFLLDYFYRVNSYVAPGMLFGHRELNAYIESHSGEDVIYSRKLSEPQSFYLYFSKLDPKIVQSYSQKWLAFESKGLSFLDQLGEYHLPGVTFKEISYTSDSTLPNTIIAGRPEEFPADITPSLIINYPNSSKAAIWVVNTNEVQ